jgi:hypothetical protein
LRLELPECILHGAKRLVLGLIRLAQIRDIRLKVAHGFDRRRRETLADDKRLRACRAGTAVGLMATGRTETRQQRRHNAGRGDDRFVFAGY